MHDAPKRNNKQALEVLFLLHNYHDAVCVKFQHVGVRKFQHVLQVP